MTTASAQSSAQVFRLGKLAREAQRQADARWWPVVVSLVERVAPLDPIAAFARMPTGLARALWRRPDGETLLGWGEALSFGTDAASFREGSPSRIAEVWRDTVRGALVEALDGCPDGVGPLLLGGFAFDPDSPPDPAWCDFPPARLVLPRVLVAGLGGEWWRVSTLVAWPGRDPAADLADLCRLRALGRVTGDGRYRAFARGRRAVVSGPVELCSAGRWREMVEQAIAAVRRGELEKVVLARAVEAAVLAGLDLDAVLRRLADLYPGCTLFAFGSGTTVFLGATPERLARLRGRRVETMALAGSIRRGVTAEEDAALAAGLLASEKDRHEHMVVVEALRRALEPVCRTLAVPEEPTLLSLRNVHHLASPVRGELARAYTVLDMVERLHPTPAVGGMPREGARAFIRTREPVGRGWYAGPVGWIDRAGDGEFAVALRSGLIRGGRVRLYAGCGIVADSDPDTEYAESQVKLEPLLRALEGA